jgi:hypothetical protein
MNVSNKIKGVKWIKIGRSKGNRNPIPPKVYMIVKRIIMEVVFGYLFIMG